MRDNPYSAPATTEPEVPTATEEQSFQSIARRVFLAWEKLRLVYIGILALVTIFLVRGTDAANGRTLFVIIEGAIAANLLYFAGPSIETYVRWLGYKEAWPRWFMFCGGALLSMLLAAAALSGNLIPNQN